MSDMGFFLLFYRKENNMKKNMMCFGDSNTFGYSGNPEEKKGRFTKEQRWPGLLQSRLSEDFFVKEAGLNGRTTVFPDPFESGLSGLDVLETQLQKVKPLTLLLIMLGTNDCKGALNASPEDITNGMKTLVEVGKNTDIWVNNSPNILVIAPPPIQAGIYQGPFAPIMGEGCVEKSLTLASHYEKMCKEENVHFFDAGDPKILSNVFNSVDFMHLTIEGHDRLAHHLHEKIMTILE